MSALARTFYRAFSAAIAISAIFAPPLQTEAWSAAGFSSDKAKFAVKFKDEVSAYRIIGVFVLPGESLALEVADNKSQDGYSLHFNAGVGSKIGNNKWLWIAPEDTGLYPVRVGRSELKDYITLNVFVMVPYDDVKGEYLNGYSIGNYPPPNPNNGHAISKPPRGFIEVTPATEDALVAPHFKLGQFLCKQEGSYPKYAVLEERLLLKLESILEKVNEEGYRCNTLYIMSGYRTPRYNQAIRNVKYSRHLWGSAADIFIDVHPEDGMMDDLNADGKADLSDAAILFDIINRMDSDPQYSCVLGGLGKYPKTAAHGPFVHIDARGYRARW